MDGIIIIVVLYFLFNIIFKRIKAINGSKDSQASIEATKRAPAKPPISQKKADARFPSAAIPSQTTIAREGRDPDAELHTYTPIASSMGLESQFSTYSSTVAPSADLKKRFSEYQGSLGAPVTEGAGYQAEAYDDIPIPYSTDAQSTLKVLPEKLTRDTLVQAVVMSEILKRPGVHR